MKVLIIEDEALAAEKLSRTLKSVSPDCEILDILNSVDSALEWFSQNEEPDVILSDIHLADGICFNIYSEVQLQCPIIFTTAYEKYAIQAFEVNSIDYLLKPVQEERLRAALSKYSTLKDRQQKDRAGLFEEFKIALSKANREYKSRFLCKVGNKIKSIPTDKIRYFYSKNKMTFIVDESQSRFPVNNTLDEIDNLIDPQNFFRINRQFVVHYSAISEIHPYFKGRLKLKLTPDVDEDIIVSAERSPVFKAWLDK